MSADSRPETGNIYPIGADKEEAASGEADMTASAPSAKILIALLLPLFASLMSISSVMVALPAIEEGLGASSADLQWIVSGYALAFGIGLVPAGRAGDLWGRSRVFTLGVVLFGLTSLAVALAPNPTMLSVLRIAMGLAAAVLVPQIIGLIQWLFSGSARGQAYGLMGTVIGAAVAVGPLIGGLLIDGVGGQHAWRMVFFVNVPVVIIALFFAVKWLPRGARGDSSDVGSRSWLRQLQRLDPLGALLLAMGIIGILLPLIQFPNLLGVLIAIAGLGFLALWLLWERKLSALDPQAPMVNLSLFKIPTFTLNSSVLMLYFAGMPGLWAVVPIYVQQGLGFGAIVAGLVTLPGAVMVMVLSSYAGRRVPRWGQKMLIAGAGISVVSMASMAFGVGVSDAQSAHSLWWLAGGLGLNGIAQSLLITGAQTLSMQDVPETIASSAGGVAQAAQRVATAIGIAIVTAAYFAVLAAYGHQQAVQVSLLIVGAGMLATLVTAAIAHRVSRRSVRS